MVGGSCIKVVVAYKRAFWLDQRTRQGGSEPHVASLGPAHNIFHSSAAGLYILRHLLSTFVYDMRSLLHLSSTRQAHP
jgi:monoamine oxidase